MILLALFGRISSVGLFFQWSGASVYLLPLWYLLINLYWWKALTVVNIKHTESRRGYYTHLWYTDRYE